ncbi:hypothetical protein AQUCO_00700699v1 [Aquilegia coerulea]|uniref:Cyclin-like domain-containing protein n=1 Tax=Aquilegia coerulea TaxID=218851 RepID=A0A2G5ELS7_AQUCA|nr:hypothetical protein AQUCO_00700699v1 [Aquilegia coerulea]
MSSRFCKYCAKVCITVRGDDGFVCCLVCGRVIVQVNYTDEIGFYKDAGGQSRMAGSIIKSVESGCSESYQRTLDKGRDQISYLVENLGISNGGSITDEASKYYRIAVDRNFTRGRGRTTTLVAAVCLYIACRLNKHAYLLIDFSEELRVNVYVLGALFLQLCEKLRLEKHPILMKPVDPSLFISRFTDRLLGGGNDNGFTRKRNAEVSSTALRIIASMKRDWMQTGRKPSGLCGAAVYISAHSYGIKCSKSDIAAVVHVCEATLTKRLIEFENTESGGLTIKEFIEKAEAEKDMGSRQPSNLGINSSGKMELLCEHKNDSKKPDVFAIGLCKSCYENFVELSGGLQGGSDPPAFQRAERGRITKESADETSEDADMCEKEAEPFSQPNQDMNVNEKVASHQSKGIGGVNGSQAVEEGACGKSNGHVDMGNVAGDESESLSDIDDVEVNGYLHDEDEKRLKTILWETLNREYVEEEAAKKAANEAYAAKFQNGSDEMLAAHELAAATAAAVAKSRKERQQKRALEAKNAAPPRTPAEATGQMLKKRKLSSKINYDVLDQLFDDTDTNKIGSNSHEDANIQKHAEGNDDFPSDFVDNDDYVGQEDEYGEGYTAPEMYGDDLYHGNEEADEYGYEDYGY